MLLNLTVFGKDTSSIYIFISKSRLFKQRKNKIRTNKEKHRKKAQKQNNHNIRYLQLVFFKENA